MASPKAAAEAFVKSYADAMELSLQSNTTVEACAHALASHYTPATMNFTMGHQTSANGVPDFWLTGINAHLKRFNKSGLGWKIHLKSARVEPLSSTAAACFLTWEIEPAKGEGWAWENIYGWRGNQDAGGKGYWEYIVSDNEVGELIKRFPEFMQLEV